VNPTFESLSDDEGVKSALGSSLITVVYKDSDGIYSSQSFSGDFALELKDVADFDEYIFLLRVSQINARIDEGRLCVGYDLEINILSWKSEFSEIIKTSQIIGEDLSESRKPFTVYYPQKGETLWEVGKKYNVELSALAASNPSCGENTEKMPSVLLIPRHKQAKKVNNS
jgi:LysM repeat protein